MKSKPIHVHSRIGFDKVFFFTKWSNFLKKSYTFHINYHSYKILLILFSFAIVFNQCECKGWKNHFEWKNVEKKRKYS